MIRVGIVGLGWWGRTLNERLRSSRKLRVTHGMDVSLTNLGREDGLKNMCLLDDYERLLSMEEVDAVIIATPHALHEAQVIKAAQKGKHVFCEKPLCLSAAGARRMVAACHDNGIVLGVGHERRFEVALVALADLIRAGELGEIVHVDCNWSHDGLRNLDSSNWRKDPTHAPAGLLTGLGVHITDWFQDTLGPVTRLTAEANRGSRMGLTDEAISVKLEFETGVTGWLCCLGITPFYFRLVVFGDRGWAEVRQFHNVDVETKAFVDLRLTGQEVERREYPMNDAILANLEAWADSISGGQTYPNTPAQMIHNIEILEAIVTSAREGAREVDLATLATDRCVSPQIRPQDSHPSRTVRKG